MTSRADGPGPSRGAALFAAWNDRLPSAGHLALAALLLGTVTGIALATAYDVGAPLRSIGLLEVSSPIGRLVRSVHAWSGHLLLALALLHVVEHLLVRSEARARFAAWVRMVALVPFLLALMLSGFVLRGDAEGELARQVVSGLLGRLPGGAALVSVLAGAGSDLQVVYLHHAATLTLAVLLLAVEHARRTWPSSRAAVGLLATALAAAVLFPPVLHDGVDPVVKGPWYFVAMQELLHWLTRPGWAWILAALPLALLLALPRLEGRPRGLALGALGAGLVLYALAGLFATFFRGAGWDLRVPGRIAGASRGPVPALVPLTSSRLDDGKAILPSGKVEGCVACHDGVTGIEASHDPKNLGCAGCHLGNPLAASASAAHAGMVRVPGNLDTAALTCGRAGCHGEIVGRVKGSLMATLRGMIAVDRWAFGERPTPDGTDVVADLGRSPADTHLEQLCVACHLGTPKGKPAPTTELSRGGGCLACHLREGGKRDYGPKNAARFAHPRLALKAPDAGCFGCHSRSARISLSYAGWWDSGVREDEAEGLPAGSVRRLEDGRLLSRASADVHHEKGMGCVDCHTAGEVMGDGKVHGHEDEATRVRCTTCHRLEPVRTVASGTLDPATRFAVQAHLGERPPARLLAEDRSGEALTNAWPGDGWNVEMVGKLDGRRRIARPPGPSCSGLPGHERLSCQACHSPWTTSCTSCHTQWDPKGSVDAGIRRGPGLPGAPGAWVEYDGKPRIEAPALGVLTRDGVQRIEPVVPGMILTLNGPGAPAPDPLPASAEGLRGKGTRFLRAWALAVPHTTTKAGRSCTSCHANPVALGYGRGDLVLGTDSAGATWRFEPAFAPSGFDPLPSDAWIGFLSSSGGAATRRGLRPLEREAQLRTLGVGACLPCHDPATPAGLSLYRRFRESLRSARPACRVPRAP